MLDLFEHQIGYKCDEAFLEDSAIRLLKQSFRKHECTCSPYKYILVDIDDPTINLQRFMNSANQIFTDNNTKIKVIGCSNKDNQKTKTSCDHLGVELLKKPVSVNSVRHLVK